MKKNPIIVLKPKREETLSRFHLWVFSGAIDRIEGTPKEGDVVDVVNSFGSLVAGLISNAGVGLAVLFKNTKEVKRNLFVLLTLYLIGAFTGLLVTFFMVLI